VDVAQRLASVLAGRYQIEREIGRGGMALVFLARDLKHDRRVAVKVLRPDLSAAIGVERFLREIQIGASLQHPHIVPLHDSGEAGGLPFYVMAYVEGESLRDRLEREKQLPLDEAIRIARDVAEALGHAHSHGVVHRDVKPENILLSGGHALVADFGVARALSAAAVGVTGTGLAVGTPTYMSPEQAGGMDAVDGRSDLYALGCVLYEMLVGEPPFTGPTASAILARHMQETVPGVRIVRPTVPPGLEAVLDRLLAKIPADRYPTASAFIEALARPPDRAAASPRVRRNRWLAAALVPVVLGGAVVTGVLFRRPAEPDPLAYVVLPFAHREGAEPSLLDGVQCQWRLADALQGWDQVSVADPIVVRDAARRLGDAPPSHTDWLRIARDLGFGTVVRGEVAELADTVLLVVTAYRAPGGTVVGRARAGFMPAAADVRHTFERLAAQLLGLAAPGRAGAPVGTRSLGAGRAFARGQQVLAEGDPVLAEASFLEAVQSDPAFGDAQFWLAQVRVWRGLTADSVTSVAQRALDAQAGLTDARAQALVAALVDLARGRLPEACARYGQVVARDSADFAAWFGLAECGFRDNAVGRNPASPSGWSFRSSYHAAGEAYRRGLAAAPFLSGAVSERLRQVMFVERGRGRRGWAISPDTGQFWAFPALAADTLAFVPYRAAEVRTGAVDEPPTLEAALERNRLALAEIASRWAEAYPRSAAALAAVAANLEELARSGRGAVGVTEALDRVRQARALDAGPRARIGLAHIEVRLLVKLERFEEARRLADSTLAAEPDPDPRAAYELAALAALLGQPDRAARLLEVAVPFLESDHEPRFAGVALPVLAARERLRAYAAVGAPVDSLRRLPAVVDSLVTLWAPGGAAELRRLLLEEPCTMAFPVVGAGSLHRLDAPSYLLRLQARLAAGDAAGVRAGLDSLGAIRRGLRPQDVTMGAFYQEMWLRLQAGDTATAVEALDRMFADLSLLSTAVLSDVTNSAALVRAMALRAMLDTDRDRGGRRWARAVTTLWRDAAPELAPITRAMHALGG
jgi:tetratricopeptide (TPR) repeat protein